MSPCGPTLPTWALQQVGSYLGYTGRAADTLATVARGPALPTWMAQQIRSYPGNPGRDGERDGTWLSESGFARSRRRTCDNAPSMAEAAVGPRADLQDQEATLDFADSPTASKSRVGRRSNQAADTLR
jgi:hypothetical protein